MVRREALPHVWRALALAGLGAGLALAAPLESGNGISGPSTGGMGTRGSLAAIAGLATALTLARPRIGSGGALPWLALVAITALLGGLALGTVRLAAIEGARLVGEEGGRVELRGTVVSALRTSGGVTRFTLETAEGRLGVELLSQGQPTQPEGAPAARAGSGSQAIDEGAEINVEGTLREPAPWEEAQVERSGAAFVLTAESAVPTGATRRGLLGALDDVRRRAELALEQGTSPLGAALLRGFVLGQDDRIPEDVREEFRRSGLAHVLAVSGQNVMLLALLATPLLALAGVPLRLRLVVIALVIAIYVPVAGAGASIQRAGIMGIAGIVAALASRPSARWYALCLAGVVTLLIDPRATADIGWQLSFCAVAGLLVLAQPLIRVLGRGQTGARRALAEGVAMTVAATLATAPLAAHHFGTVSLTALPANLLALPAIAPAMWLGMLSGALGQVPGAPVEALTWLGGHCAGFIGWVAHALGATWAQLDVAEPGAPVALAWTIVLVGGARLVCLQVERRAALRPFPRAPRRAGLAGLAACAVLMGGAAVFSDDDTGAEPPTLVIRILDVGQGDAILVQPRAQLPLLVDTGPPDSGIGEMLEGLGIDRLAAIAITHDELDHSGGLGDVLAQAKAEQLLSAFGPPRSCRDLDCPPTTGVAAGSRFRLGPARAQVLWPPQDAEQGADPNETALVLRITQGEFDALLTADAESEAANFRGSPTELLKVAHHGSADSGLAALLSRTSPALAAISVGEGNPYGHPAPETTQTLESHGVPVVRTDDDGEIVVEVRGDGWTVR